MIGPTVESVFGTNAGIVWRALNKNGSSNISDIVKATSLTREEIHGALGWLGRENKIVMQRRARAIFFSLPDSELSRSASSSASMEQKKESLHPLPKKAAKAGRIKASNATLMAAKRALAFILAEIEANRQPTVSEVSKAVNMHSRQLGRVLSSLEVKSKSIRIKGKAVQVYPIDLRAKVWELAALDVEGLQKTIERRQQAVEAEREQNQERVTVFD